MNVSLGVSIVNGMILQADYTSNRKDAEPVWQADAALIVTVYFATLNSSLVCHCRSFPVPPLGVTNDCAGVILCM